MEGDRRRYDVALAVRNINNTGLTRSARFEKIETIARRTFRLDDVPPSQGRELVLQSRIQSGRLAVPGAIQVFQERTAGNLREGRAA